MDITEISKRNYAAQLRRGTITDETTLGNFIDKIDEELHELAMSHNLSDNSFDHSELADIVLVCFALAEHAGIDLIKEMADKMEFNEQRND